MTEKNIHLLFPATPSGYKSDPTATREQANKEPGDHHACFVLGENRKGSSTNHYTHEFLKQRHTFSFTKVNDRTCETMESMIKERDGPSLGKTH
jgi:hypothetical protein